MNSNINMKNARLLHRANVVICSVQWLLFARTGQIITLIGLMQGRGKARASGATATGARQGAVGTICQKYS